MRISFNCTTNVGIPYINIATFLKKDGTRVVVDREITEYTYDKKTGKMSMEWRGCYIWDGESESYDFPYDIFNGAVLESLEIEDDAPEKYAFTCDRCYVDTGFTSKEVPVKIKKTEE